MKRNLNNLTAFFLLACVGVTLVSAETSRRSRVRGFVEAFNSGDVDQLMNYLDESSTEEFLARRSVDDRRQLFTGLLQELGEIEARGVTFDGETVSLRASSSKTDDNILFELKFQDSSPYLLEELGVDIGAESPDGLPALPKVSDFGPESDRVLDEFLQRLTREGDFSGSVLVTIDGDTAFSGAYGLADRSWKIPNTLETRFNLGSINKAFTKVAIGQLVATGKLALEDTLLDVIPDFGNPEAAEKITIDLLLEHKAGLAGLFVPAFSKANKGSLRTNRDYFPIFENEPLQFEPGSDQRYCNSCYIVLGEIVSLVSGVPYIEYVKENIWKPAGMTGAAFAANDEVHENVAVGYTTVPSTTGGADSVRSNVFMLPVVGIGAGGAVAMASDLAAFDQALRNEKLLDVRFETWYFTGELPEEAPATLGDHAVGIAGGGPGVSATLEGEPRYSVVVLSNMDQVALSLTSALSQRVRAVLER